MVWPIVIAGLGIGSAIALDQATDDFLYGDWNEEKYNVFQRLYAIPGLREYFDYKLDSRRAGEYMDRYQVNWSDIHDPRKLHSSSSYGYVLNYVSRNVSRLYR